MYKEINQKTKRMWRGALYAALGIFGLLSCESAFSKSSPISGTITVNLSNLPSGWIANQVNEDGSQTQIKKTSWSKQYNFPVHTNGAQVGLVEQKKVWVVFIFDSHGTRKGAFVYGASLQCSSPDCGSGNSKIAAHVVYKNTGAVSFAGYAINVVPNTETVFKTAFCHYHYSTKVNMIYNFTFK